MSETDELVAQADTAMRRRSAVISGHRYQPKLVWTITPRTEDELRALVTAEGNSPLVYLASMQLPRSALMWAGAPIWAMYAYLVLVEVKALFGAMP